MAPKGYDNVNLPHGLYVEIKTLVKGHTELGYRSVAEFVAESVRLNYARCGQLLTRRASLDPLTLVLSEAQQEPKTA